MNIGEAIDYATEIREGWARPCPLCQQGGKGAHFYTRIGLLEHLKRQHLSRAA